VVRRVERDWRQSISASLVATASEVSNDPSGYIAKPPPSEEVLSDDRVAVWIEIARHGVNVSSMSRRVEGAEGFGA